ncbi:MAG: thiamine-phosphate kinase [Nitrospirota bacterium]
MKLSHIGELALLESIRTRFSSRSKDIITGIGDDAAVVQTRMKPIVVTTDMMVEGVHFDLSFTEPFQLGFKIVSVNVSDVYAMGGTPRYLLLNMAVRKTADMDFIDSFFEGIQDALHRYRAKLIGGDISGAVSGMCLSATCIGYGERVVNRSGARPGDTVYVTGTLGDSACGLALLKKRKKSSLPDGSLVNGRSEGRTKIPRRITEPLVTRHLMPVARSPKSFARYATAMIDVSDGLLIDLSRLCEESRVGARIFLEKIPLSPQLRKAAEATGTQPIEFALSGGEDYELLFTAAGKKKIRASAIGEIIESGLVIVDQSGTEKPFSPVGYQHFLAQGKGRSSS